MLDLQLNEAGDIIISPANKIQPFHLSFRISEHKGFRLQFHCLPNQDIYKNKNFNIQFETCNRDIREKTRAETVKDDAAITQLLRMRFSTEPAEAGRKSLASNIQSMKHSMYIDDNMCNNIVTEVIANIADILPNATVTAEPAIGVGNFYCQNISVSIFNSDSELVYQFCV